tara:strand:+ start:626 stop:793 length:168 start_codon:yes stop_codon:yes gene_type:complete
MNIWRELNKEEEKDFKKWARENYKIGEQVNEAYHPVVQQECDLMNREHAYKDKQR